MALAAVDIGTNSMRLLITDDDLNEIGRWEQITGLGRGVEQTGELTEEAVRSTLDVLAEYGRLIRQHGATARAVATSATRDAGNRQSFLDRATEALGVRSETIEGSEEAELSYRGATTDMSGESPMVVVDVGGGSTEISWERDGEMVAVSAQVGSVRLTDSLLPDRPATFEQLEDASRTVERRLEVAELPASVGTVVGVAGTWTTLAAIESGAPSYDPGVVHGFSLSRLAVDRLVERLASLTVEETATIPSLHPARAPVILAGAVIARESMRLLAALEVVVSVRDLLDGVILSLRDQR